MVRLTVDFFKFPDAIPEPGPKLVVYKQGGRYRVTKRTWFTRSGFTGLNVIAWAEMPVYTEGE